MKTSHTFHTVVITMLSLKGKYGCMVHLSPWPVTQAGRQGTSADGKCGEVPKSPERERDLGVKGHRIESYIMEKRNMLSAVTVESKKL